MFDRRVLNAAYSLPPCKLFAALASLMGDNDFQAGPPHLLGGNGFIGQRYGECPANSGVVIYFRMSRDGTQVLVFDPETDFNYSLPSEMVDWEDHMAGHRFVYQPSTLEKDLFMVAHGQY